ncbi:MAG: thioredoxin-disulfide reductase [Candidatus Methanospirare jalkutatii]|nr:thioredoxin-disulfide reductase [Candidatus Methanospirare jalkutatii]
MLYDLTVVGGGPAGLSAAIYAVRSGLNTLLIEKGLCGGLLNEIPQIENYPAFKSISGMELASKLKEHASEYAEIRELEEVLSLKRKGANFVVKTDKGEYETRAVALCTGSRKRKLGVEGEEKFLGKGVSYCATCDGFFFKNKRVLVVGGGNSAVTEALFLKNIGCNVTLVHRRDTLRAEKYLQMRLLKEIPVRWNAEVRRIEGEEQVRKVVIYDKKRQREEEIECDAVFIAIGEEPNSELASQLGVALDPDKYIITDKHQRTNVQRVYAAGDVAGGLRQVVVACAEGAVAAISAYNDLNLRTF